MNTPISFLAAGLLAVAFTATVKTADAAPVRGKPAPQVRKLPPDPCRTGCKQTRSIVIRGRPGPIFLNPQPLPPG